MSDIRPEARYLDRMRFIQPFLVPVKKAKVLTILAALRHNTFIVGLRIAPHLRQGHYPVTIRKNRIAQP